MMTRQQKRWRRRGRRLKTIAEGNIHERYAALAIGSIADGSAVVARTEPGQVRDSVVSSNIARMITEMLRDNDNIAMSDCVWICRPITAMQCADVLAHGWRDRLQILGARVLCSNEMPDLSEAGAMCLVHARCGEWHGTDAPLWYDETGTRPVTSCRCVALAGLGGAT